MKIQLEQRILPAKRKIASKLGCDAGDFITRQIDNGYEKQKNLTKLVKSLSERGNDCQRRKGKLRL